MKQLFCFLFLMPLCLTLNGQGQIVGNVYLMNSKFETGKRTPIAGVKINAIGSNGDYSKSQGEYLLEFKQLDKRKTTRISIGGEDKVQDANGNELELVNKNKLGLVTIPENAKEIPINIIVCPKGYRDLAAEKYYNIIKSSSDAELEKIEKEYKSLLKEKEQDYKKISELSSQLLKFQALADSASLYRKAFELASINKDDANDRILEYLTCIEEGGYIQNCKEILSKEKATIQGKTAVSSFDDAIAELKTKASASESVFDFDDAIACTDSIIQLCIKQKLNAIIVSDYYLDIADYSNTNSQYKKSINYLEGAISYMESSFVKNDTLLAKIYSRIGNNYGSISLDSFGLKYHNDAILLLQDKIKDNKIEYLYGIAIQNRAVNYLTLELYEESMEGFLIAKDILEKNQYADTNLLAILYDNLGFLHANLGNYKKSLNYRKTAKDMREKELSPNDPLLGLSYISVGMGHSNIGEFQAAEDFMLKGLRLREKILSPNHKELAFNYQDIGGLYRRMGNFPEALKYVQKGQSIMMLYDSLSTDMASIYDGMGKIYDGLGDYNKAIFFYNKSIDVLLTAKADSTLVLANVYNSLSASLHKIGENKTGVKYAETSLAIKLSKLDSTHLSVSDSYSNLANNLQELNRPEEALIYHRKALNNALFTFDSTNIEVGIQYMYIGNDYYLLKDYQKAQAFYMKSIEISENTFGESHSQTALVYNSLAITLEALKLYEESLTYYNKCRSILEKTLGVDHPQLSQLYINIGSVFKSMSNADSTLYYYNLADKNLEKNFGPEHLKTALNYHRTAEVYRLVGKKSEAIIQYSRAAKAYEKDSVSNYEMLANCYVMVGRIYLDSTNYEMAIHWFQKGINFAKKESTYQGLFNWNMGLSRKGLGQYITAINHLQLAQRIFLKNLPPDHAYFNQLNFHLAGAYHEYGVSCNKEKKYDLAIENFEKVLEIQYYRDTWIFKGRAERKIEAFKKSIKSFETATTVDTDSSYIKTYYFCDLAITHIMNQEFKKAKNYLDQIEADGRIKPLELDQCWAMFYSMKKENEQAISYLKSAIELGFNNLDFLTNSKSLDSIRNEPAFKKILNDLKSKTKNVD